MVCQPQPDAEGLEPVVGVQCLGEEWEAESGPMAPGAAQPQGAERVSSCPGPTARPFSWSAPPRRPVSAELLQSREDMSLYRPGPEKHFI